MNVCTINMISMCSIVTTHIHKQETNTCIKMIVSPNPTVHRFYNYQMCKGHDWVSHVWQLRSFIHCALVYYVNDTKSTILYIPLTMDGFRCRLINWIRFCEYYKQIYFMTKETNKQTKLLLPLDFCNLRV